MGAMCYSEATKGEITHTEHWKKTCMEDTCYIATTTKNIHHIESWKKSMYNRCGNSTTSSQKLIKLIEPSRSYWDYKYLIELYSGTN